MVGPGDYDSDHDVDAEDLLTLIGHWTGPLEPLSGNRDFTSGDADFDWDVDSNDLVVFLGAWTGIQGAQSNLAVVPEPQLAGLASLIGWAACRRRFCSRSRSRSRGK